MDVYQDLHIGRHDSIVQCYLLLASTSDCSYTLGVPFHHSFGTCRSERCTALSGMVSLYTWIHASHILRLSRRRSLWHFRPSQTRGLTSPCRPSLQGPNLTGSLGNSVASLILFNPNQNCSIRFKPSPPPPCWGHP